MLALLVIGFTINVHTASSEQSHSDWSTPKMVCMIMTFHRIFHRFGSYTSWATSSGYSMMAPLNKPACLCQLVAPLFADGRAFDSKHKNVATQLMVGVQDMYALNAWLVFVGAPSPNKMRRDSDKYRVMVGGDGVSVRGRCLWRDDQSDVVLLEGDMESVAVHIEQRQISVLIQ